MRSEKEMFELLISTARNDERILAAYLEGSRTVPQVPSCKLTPAAIPRPEKILTEYTG